MIKTGFQVGKRTTSKVEFDLVERAGAGGSAKINLAPGVGAPAGDAS